MAFNALRRTAQRAPQLLAQTLGAGSQMRSQSSHSENTNIFIRGGC